MRRRWASLVGVFYAASGAHPVRRRLRSSIASARVRCSSAGIALLAGGTCAASLAPGFGWLFPLVALMGIGNGVFHPGRFRDPQRQRRAAPPRPRVQRRTAIGGNLGYALAPVVSFALGALFGWRIALVAMGALGLVALGPARDAAGVPRPRTGRRRRRRHGTRCDRQPAGSSVQAPILMCFAYFMLHTMATIGLQTFAPTALNAGFGRSARRSRPLR